MWLLGRIALISTFGVLALAPGQGFGQAGPTAPPAGEIAPDAGTVAPDAPEGGPLPPVLPMAPDVSPPTNFGPTMGGRDCEHERSPGTGV